MRTLGGWRIGWHDMNDRTRSHLLKARQLEQSIRDDQLPSVRITQAQDAAEHAFRAILFGMGIKRVREHRLDVMAQEHHQQLVDVWPRLAPLLNEYAWLWEWRNSARYRHVDVPAYSDPPITDEMVERAKRTTRRLIEIAETLVC